MLVAEKETVYRPRTKKLKILSELVYETIAGRDYYYYGFEEVLRGKKTKDEVVGTGGLQSFIVSYLFEIIAIKIDKSIYRYLTSETGVHIDHRNNLANDIAIYERSVLTPDKITNQYIDVPAKVAIEIDIKADLSRPEDHEYVYKKTEKLLSFGYEKVIWLFSNTQKVLIATQNEDWKIVNWEKDIEIIDGIIFNIANYLKEEGISILKP